MNAKEKLIKEAKEILIGHTPPVSEVKNIIYDEQSNQFSIKVPREIALAAKLDSKVKVEIVVNPDKEKLEEAQQSHFIIYAKEKEEEKSSK